jgi:signal transduction histidine kinase
MAQIQTDAGDTYGGQESLLTSLHYLRDNRQKDQPYLSSDYNLLGRTSQNLKNFDAAIGYYEQALVLTRNKSYRPIILNNIAVAYSDKKQYAHAITIYDSILNLTKNSKKDYARVLTNLAMARWQQDSTYPAATDLQKALTLRTETNDDWGLNSSYAHLAEYYEHPRPGSALLYAKKMYAVATRLRSPDDQLEALQKLILLSPANAVKTYFTRYQHLSDSLHQARNAAKNQFALIRYEAQKNKADNLRLEQENAQKKAEILSQKAIIYGSTVGFALLAAISITWYRKRRRQLESEKRNQLLQTSQRVHDIVANGLYRIMTQIEHTNEIEKSNLLDEMEILYEQSRDISYDPPESGDQSFPQTLSKLISAFAGPPPTISIVGNQTDLWEKINARARTVVELILQELMTNMRKHSGAQHVLVRFTQESHQITIQYTDDGVGFSPDTRPGNGLTSTGNRIKAIGGRISFDKNTPQGLKIEIHVPTG